jgi:hypothetical protein
MDKVEHISGLLFLVNLTTGYWTNDSSCYFLAIALGFFWLQVRNRKFQPGCNFPSGSVGRRGHDQKELHRGGCNGVQHEVGYQSQAGGTKENGGDVRQILSKRQPSIL